jgi:hypothetical protein
MYFQCSHLPCFLSCFLLIYIPTAKSKLFSHLIFIAVAYLFNPQYAGVVACCKPSSLTADRRSDRFSNLELYFRNPLRIACRRSHNLLCCPLYVNVGHLLSPLVLPYVGTILVIPYCNLLSYVRTILVIPYYIVLTYVLTILVFSYFFCYPTYERSFLSRPIFVILRTKDPCYFFLNFVILRTNSPCYPLLYFVTPCTNESLCPLSCCLILCRQGPSHSHILCPTRHTKYVINCSWLKQQLFWFAKKMFSLKMSKSTPSISSLALLDFVLSDSRTISGR